MLRRPVVRNHDDGTLPNSTSKCASSVGGPGRHIRPEIFILQIEPESRELTYLDSTKDMKKISTEPENPTGRGPLVRPPWRQSKTAKRTPENDPIKITNSNPLLHFPNACRRLNVSDVERKSNPISAPPHRSAPNPCKQHYYFGHRIRPRLRPFGRVPKATSGDRKSGWWPFLFSEPRPSGSGPFLRRICRRI
jgi:hypothetical protein